MNKNLSAIRRLAAAKTRGVDFLRWSLAPPLSARLSSDGQGERHGGQIVANVLKAHDVQQIFTLVRVKEILDPDGKYGAFAVMLMKDLNFRSAVTSRPCSLRRSS